MPRKARNSDPSERNALVQARAACARQAWLDAFTLFTVAARTSELGPPDLEQFAGAAQLLGHSAEAKALTERAHQGYTDRGDIERAAWCAFWLGFELMLAGEVGRAGGWLARAQRALDEANCDCAVRGYLLLPPAIRAARSGHVAEANAAFERAIDIGRHFEDANLVTLARHGIGRTLIHLGRVEEGFALLDEVMVAVTAGEVHTLAVGGVYCSVIEACHEMFDLRRAHEWTDALTRWCAAQPDVVPFRGHCLTRRAELLQLAGEWTGAMDEAQRACDWIARTADHWGAGSAHYRRAELHRLRGEFSAAEDAYRVASDNGCQPHPGLALLWLAEGRTDAAIAAIRRLLDEHQDLAPRARLLDAAVDVMLAANEVALARGAARELGEIAAANRAPYLVAMSASARGAVLLAEGEPRQALVELRAASEAWRAISAPFELARTRVLLAAAHHALGDAATGALEVDAALHVFEQLGAVTERARSQSALAAPKAKSSVRGAPNEVLTDREVEVVRLVATGKTNRAIAQSLGISEKTVARHVSNIFSKLRLSSRSGATAYAYEQDLLDRRHTRT